MRKAITLTLALVALSAVAFAGIAVASDLHKFGTGVVTAKKNVVRIVNDAGEYGGDLQGRQEVDASGFGRPLVRLVRRCRRGRSSLEHPDRH